MNENLLDGYRGDLWYALVEAVRIEVTRPPGAPLPIAAKSSPADLAPAN